ncbi:MAG TPA: outer membrane beta-barrel protein [Steroidobacteraceae bacterium]|nr:outer membrane beta-barrel protein [Steroidobacteraceae bacterium]
MQRRILRGLALAALALPLASHADVMDYSYAELGYVDADFDADAFDTDVDGDGFALRGSLAVNPNFFVFAGYQDLDFDFDVDASVLEVGGGGHWPLSDKIDIIGKLGIVKAEVDVGRFNDDDDGFLLGARVRGVVAPKFELEGGFDYRDLDIGDETTIVLEGRYFFIDQLAGGVSVAIGDDNTALGLNVRWTF